MIKQTGFILVLSCMLSSCINVGKQHENNDGNDTILTTEATELQKDNSLPASEQKVIDDIYAQDTLFEDGSKPTSWANAGFTDPIAFKQFVIQLKGWIKSDDATELAAHIKFPLKNIANAETFKKQYSTIFNPQAKAAIAQQRVDRIFRNQKGAMLANGMIWIAPVGSGYMITAINN